MLYLLVAVYIDYTHYSWPLVAKLICGDLGQACASLEPDYQPPVTFVVVQKRHHTRLFANNHNDRRSIDNSGNILPGELLLINVV